MNLHSYFSKEIEGNLDTEIEYKIQYFNSEWVQVLTDYNFICRREKGEW